MKILIIYDSVFGNTKKLAESIHKELNKKHNTEIYSVKDFKPDTISKYDMLIIGSPTRAFRPTEDISKMLNQYDNNSLSNIKTLVFDTRADLKKVNSKILTFMVNIFGYATPYMAKVLEKKGALVLGKEGFYVDESEGPLSKGEGERCIKWIKENIKD